MWLNYPDGIRRTTRFSLQYLQVSSYDDIGEPSPRQPMNLYWSGAHCPSALNYYETFHLHMLSLY